MSTIFAPSFFAISITLLGVLILVWLWFDFSGADLPETVSAAKPSLKHLIQTREFNGQLSRS
jgi:hypothetical protein